MVTVSYAKTPTELRAELVAELDRHLAMLEAELTGMRNKPSRAYEKAKAAHVALLHYRERLAETYVDDAQYVEMGK